ncbi:MATE efflux family protein, partial [Neoconidiobolus thromboides FSU 785]
MANIKDRNQSSGNLPLTETSSLLSKPIDDKEQDISYPFKTQAIINEIFYIISCAVPIILSTFTQFATPTLNLYSMGQFSALEVSSAALSNLFYNATANSLSLGMATALDTLCSQSFTGSSDKHQVGLHLQKGMIIQQLMLVPVYIIWWYSESILLLLKQDAEMAFLCGQYLRVMILATPPYIAFELLKKYLQAQKIMRAQTWVLLASLPVTFFLNYMLMWNPKTSIGFLGAPYTLLGSNWTLFIFMVLYINFIEGKECWGGWKEQSLKNWGVYIKLGLSGILMVCSEWWAVNIMSFSVSYLGREALAAHAITINIDIIFYSFAISLSIVASNRIGNLLGSEHINRAKLATLCLVGLGLGISMMNACILVLFKNQFASIFTHDANLQKIILTLVPFLCYYHVFDSIACVSNGILRGQGRQKIGAVVNLVSWYIIAIPISSLLGFGLHFGVQGVWGGLATALTCT